MSGIDIRLKVVSTGWLAAEERWEVTLEVAFTNRGPEVFDLDKATACQGGRLSNSVFVVEQGDAEVDYQGIMKKRAHPGPDGFFHLAPGEAHTVQVEVGEGYAFPAAGGTFQVRFDHANHFSKDDVQLVSNAVELKLAR